ncbi:hypothetical protein FB451DRAFT_1558610 [Mycena latifolia]|nr:hypothetical protein FB451DRAFT_1558610 [Mycena latifolia]
MRFNLIHCFGFFLLFHTQRASALRFDPIIGPYVKGAQVPLAWTLDGSEPAQGWELWFTAGGAGIKLDNIPPLSTSAVVPFPGGGSGTFQALSGTFVFATSNEVDTAVDSTVILSATATFSASIISGATPSAILPSNTVAQTPPPTSSAAESTSAASSHVTTNALLGIIAGTLAVIAIIVFASILLFIHRRRRIVTYRGPVPVADVEKQLANAITPFSGQPISISRASSRSLPSLPPSAALLTADARRQAYLAAQLQRLDTQQGVDTTESASIVFGPLSSVPSETTPRPFEQDRSALPSIPESGSRRDAYLSEQLHKLTAVDRRPSDGSVVFGPLSSVPSESTVRPYAPSISTVGDSPIQFRRGPTSP